MATSSDTLISEKLSINEESFYSKEGSLFFVSEALTEAFVPLEVMKRDAWTFKGKELRYRHITPESDVDALIGHIHDAWIENEKLMLLSELWGYKDELKEYQEEVKEGKLSISAGYKKTEQDNKIVAMYGRELSLTPFPKCTKEMGCKISAIVQNEESKMVDKTKEAIDLLESTLVSQNKERGERIVELEATVQLMEEKIHEGNESITKLEKDKKDLEEKVKTLEAEKKQSSTLSLRQDIIKLEDITEEKAVEEELKTLSNYSVEQLTDLKTRLERAKKIAVKTSPARQAPVIGEENSQNQTDLDKIPPEQLAARLNPQLKQYLEKANKGGNSAPAGFNSGDNPPMIS